MLLTTALLLAGAPVQIGSDDPLAVANYISRHYGLPEMTRAQFEQEKRESRAENIRSAALADSEAGFRPAQVVAREGVEVQRVRFGEPRLMLRMPGVSLTRLADGRVQIDLTSNGRAGTAQGFAPAAAWTELKQLQRAVIAAPAAENERRAKLRVGDPIPEVPPVCHAWFATVEFIAQGRVERIDGHGCNRSARSRAVMAYAERAAAMAVSALPECALMRFRGEAMDELGQCFGQFAPHTSADP